jgi:hypothetical protein
VDEAEDLRRMDQVGCIAPLCTPDPRIVGNIDQLDLHSHVIVVVGDRCRNHRRNIEFVPCVTRF